MNDPQQEVFAAVRTALVQEFGEGTVYDAGLPPEGTAYPFVYIGYTQQVDDFGNKSKINGRVYTQVHVYSNDAKRRGTVSGYLYRIKTAVLAIKTTSSHRLSLRGIDQELMPDNTTKEPLMHGVITFEHYFS